jgi:RIO-like serine/threonine protein kinase
VIATPCRRGGHVAKKPKAFLPIIDQLEKLHKMDFVHGDIRAFNTVFGEQEDQGWLVNFDFGGEPGIRRYPKLTETN